MRAASIAAFSASRLVRAAISSLVADLFSADTPDVQISVDGPGTGDGFALFCNGETDISDASRPIKDEEAQACADAGVNYVELKVGLDGITVMTNPANAAVECLTTADLYALLGICTSSGVFVMFEIWFKVPLPKGPLEALLGLQ